MSGKQSIRGEVYFWVIVLFAVALAMASVVKAEDDTSNRPRGTLKGSVIDRQTKSPLIGVTVQVEGTDRAAATDATGAFEFTRLPVGSYAIRFMSVGYVGVVRTDIIVRSKRITFLEVGLQETTTEIEGMTVSAGYFNEVDDHATSATSFSAEEVRRAPGSAGDVSRIMAVLPSVAKVNDQLNSLVVRGGSPTENAFYIDNIEIPNINHFPLQGTSGGPISMVNVDFLRAVTFSAGGFGAAYGDRLSSVMDIEFRVGNRDELDLQLDMNMAGFGVLGEGPLAGGKGSWLVSVRRSYLDLIVDAIGTGIAPRYGDINAKVAVDLAPSTKLSLLAIGGVDEVNFDSAQAVEDDNVAYGSHKGYEYAAGLNLRQLWGNNGYSNTSLSVLGTKYEGTFYEVSTGDSLTSQNSIESAIQVRNVNHFRLNDRSNIEFGFDYKHHLDSYDYYVREYTNLFGENIPELIVKKDFDSPRVGAFTSLTLRPLPRLTTKLGARFDYFEYNDHTHIAPRFSASYQLTDRTSINAAAGIYYQFLPITLLSQQASFRELADPVSRHYILGVTHRLGEATRLTVEGYYKDYDNFPVDPIQPELFISDEIAFARIVGIFENLESIGKARSYGIEVTLQKKLAQNIYGLASTSLYKAEYKAGDGIWRDRIFDNRLLFSMEGGYKPNDAWEFSLRWIYAGGAPHTPLDLTASQALNRTVKDRDRVNDVRFPDYHSLNIRVDRRFNFRGSSLILYLSVWNAYNRENVAEYYWNEADRKQDTMYQWSLIPLLGVEYEF
ncbi:TonB-dependent receptor plug domain-containing protein [candidate division GN15 bacterium]|nr:TonB-dependent receptor plug domain-containing protein [candidate division GN15 bacterium]